MYRHQAYERRLLSSESLALALVFAILLLLPLAAIPRDLQQQLSHTADRALGQLGIPGVGWHPPAARATPIPESQDSTYFPDTGHNLQGAFKRFWDSSSGAVRFGPPLTEALTETDPATGDALTVQYFEKARLELHPVDGTQQVMIGLLGRELTRGRDFPTVPAPARLEPGMRYFPETGQRLVSGFAAFWESNQGLRYLGYPISGEIDEVSAEDGTRHVVQYFERGRLEYFPAAADGQTIRTGAIGRDLLELKDWF